MSLDRRIVSILYHNGITDVNKVEKFIGENNNYYEVIINGKIEKLKIPGSIYLDNYDFFEELADTIQEKSEKFVELLTEIVNPDEKILMKERTVEESFLEAEKSTTLLTTTTLTFEEELEKTDAENNNFLEKLETENKIFLDEIKLPVKEVKKSELKKPEVKKTEVKPVAKTKAVKSKKLDDDIDNFIDLA
jgi:hypothetical protein